MSDDRFTVECVAVHKTDSGDDKPTYMSQWRNVSDEGIITEVWFVYPECDGTEDVVGTLLDMSIHDTNYEDNSTQEGTIQS